MKAKTTFVVFVSSCRSRTSATSFKLLLPGICCPQVKFSQLSLQSRILHCNIFLQHIYFSARNMTRLVKRSTNQLVDLPGLTAFGHLTGQVHTWWTARRKTKHLFKSRKSLPAEYCSKTKQFIFLMAPRALLSFWWVVFTDLCYVVQVQKHSTKVCLS